MVVIALESVPKMKTSSARLSKGPGRWFDSKGDNLKSKLEQTSIVKISDKEEL